MVKGIYDLMILGTGAAAMAAAIYAGRYGLKTIIIGKEVGGATNYGGPIENYPGHIGSGIELMEKFKKQAEEFGAVFVAGHIELLKKAKSGYVAMVGDKRYEGKALVVGLGSERRKLGVPGEKEFEGKGVSYCATCDGNFFKGKTVAVIGGADAAAKSAIYLSDICKNVYISYRKDKLRAEPINVQNVLGRKNIKILYNTQPEEIQGDTKVTGLKLKSSIGKKLTNDIVKLDAVFIEIGSTPTVEIFQDLNLKTDQAGYILVDKNGKTNVPGVFAAGDGANNAFKQTITAAADGVLCAKAAYDYVKLGKA